MDERIREVTRELAAIADDARASFGDLSHEQLNWKPSVNSWSVAQCLEHVIKSNHEFDADFDKLSDGTRKNSLWENFSPFSGWAGSFLVGVIKNDSKKAKAPTHRIVPPSDIERGIVEKFIDEIAAVSRKVEAIAAADRRKTVVTSPFLKVFTYRLDDALSVLVEHSKRHLRQAKRVVTTEGFKNGGTTR